MLEQILTQVIPHLQLITAALILLVAVLQLIHIGQTSRINKKLSRAGRWLQHYLNTVFSESTQEYVEEETGEEVEVPESMNTSTQELSMQLDMQRQRSVQEEHMRTSLERKKLKKDEELLDSVLQEIFD